MHYSAGKYQAAITAEIENWQKENKVKRLWDHDATLWTNSDESNWMGWLNIASEETEIARIKSLANEIKNQGVVDIVLMGMGGSSLCPAMMVKTFGKIEGYPQLHILDSTDPVQIRHLEEKINLKKTIFIVSSKSGSTLEPTIFKAYFYERLQTVLNKKEVGNRFIAITDPGTALETMAKTDRFKAIFHGIPSVGGRYSALSNFGMVPAGLMGVDVEAFLNFVETMRQKCMESVSVKENPGVVLGVILGVCAKQGKDKVTLIASPGIHDLGAWLEQLLAESTGKNDKGLIPVDQEPLGQPEDYGDDRLFIYIRLTPKPDLNQDRAIDALEKAGFVVVRIDLADKMHLGAELFRFEIATDVAGSILGIDPFNQPDVEESKVLTLQLTNQYDETGKLNQPKPFFEELGISLFTDEKNQMEIEKKLKSERSLSAYLQAHLNRIHPGDYFDLSAFIEMSDEHTDVLQKIRTQVRNDKKVATCLGFGPRFLHSTGQAYKGGPNTGVFIQITTDYHDGILIPGHHYTFGLVITAQAQADMAVLLKRSRRVLRVHLGKEVRGGLNRLLNYLQ